MTTVEPTVPYDIVVPTVGRPSLDRLLASLAASGAVPASVTLVDDRRAAASALAPQGWPDASSLRVISTGGRGPAAARNAGAAAGRAPWVVFLDDDVVVEPDWAAALARDLDGAAPACGAVDARITVPMPTRRRPTDWERNVSGLADARWISADIAVRRVALDELGGFDERFPRAYREDSDFALRLIDSGWTIGVGTRRTVHPVRPASPFVSVRNQRGNADDVLMRRLHGADFRRRLAEPPSLLGRHALTTTAALLAAAAVAAGRRRAAVAWTAGWAVATGTFAWRRIAPGPRDGREVADMVVTSVLIPPVACYHHLRARVGGAPRAA